MPICSKSCSTACTAGSFKSIPAESALLRPELGSPCEEPGADPGAELGLISTPLGGIIDCGGPDGAALFL